MIMIKIISAAIITMHMHFLEHYKCFLPYTNFF